MDGKINHDFFSHFSDNPEDTAMTFLGSDPEADPAKNPAMTSTSTNNGQAPVTLNGSSVLGTPPKVVISPAGNCDGQPL